jgi:hypothetical protein
MRSRLLGCAFAVLLVGVGPALAWSEPRCRHTPALRLPICTVWRDAASAEGKINLGFAIAGTGVSLLVTQDGWHMPGRGSLTALISVDRGKPVRRDSRTNGSVVLVVLTEDDANLLAGGTSVQIRLPATTIDASLDGSREALSALSEAWLASKAASDPFATP